MNRSPARLGTLLGVVLLPLLALAGVLWHWGAGGTEWRLSNVTGVSGELPADGSLGQSFTVRYPGLSAVGLQIATYQRVNTGTLDLRLLGPDNRELAQATLAKPALVDNGVAWFGFAPLPAATAGQVLRLELRDPTAVPGRNTVTVYLNDRDAYGGGTAYLNGAPVPAVDLALGLRYAVTPPELWAGQIAAWARAVPPGLVVLGALAALGWLAGCVWLIVRLARGLLLDPQADSAERQAGLKPAPTSAEHAEALAGLKPAPTSAEHAEALAGLKPAPISAEHAEAQTGLGPAPTAQDERQADVKPAPIPQEAQAGFKPDSTAQGYGGRLLRVPAPDARALLLVMLLGLAYAATWAVFMPPWHGPDEPAHLAAAVVFAKDGHAVEDPAVRAAIIASMDRHQFTRYVPWAPDPGAGADRFLYVPGVTGDTIWFEQRQPQTYYRLLATVFHLAGLVPTGPANLDVAAIERLLYAGRAVSVLLQTLLVACAWLAGRGLFGRRDAANAVGLGAALLPMPAFIHATVNNDALAAAAGALLALYTVRAVQRPRLTDLILLVAGAGLAVTAKGTALPVVGLAGLGLALGLWLHARRRARLVAASAVAVAVLLLAGLAVATIDSTGRAQSWVSPRTFLPGPGQRQAAAQPHDGRYTLLLAPREQVMQRVDLPPGHGVYTATATVWARAPVTGTALAGLASDYDSPPAMQAVLVGAGWTPLTVTAQVPAPAAAVRFALQAGSDGSVEFDDARLVLAPAPGAPIPPDAPPPGDNVLSNGSFETATRVPPALPGVLGNLERASLLDYLLDPTDLDTFWSQETQQFRTFWGSFGWVAVDLDPALYAVLAALMMLGVLGLAPALRWPGAADGAAPARRATLALLAVVLLGGIVISFVRTTAANKIIGTREFPQGRYLFPLLVPILCLLVAAARGWGAILRQGLGTQRANRLMGWLRYAGAIALVAFALLALTLVADFYYGLP
jgi:hypothetical protein